MVRMQNKVVITGMGCISPVGNNVDPFGVTSYREVRYNRSPITTQPNTNVRSPPRSKILTRWSILVPVKPAEWTALPSLPWLPLSQALRDASLGSH